MFRITVMTVVLSAREVHRAASEATLPVSLQTSPAGPAWIDALVPSSSAAASALTAVLLVSAVAGLVGIFTRPALALTAACLLFLLAIPQRWGQGVHSHHLLWFSALLAAGPSGAAGSHRSAARSLVELSPDVRHERSADRAVLPQDDRREPGAPG